MKKYIPFLFILLGSVYSCKNSLLDEFPNKSLIIPTKLSDFRALIENNMVMNAIPALQIISSDDFIVTESAWRSFNLIIERNAYIWAEDLFEGLLVSEWNKPYEQILYSNIILDGLSSINIENTIDENEKNHIKGAALFYRGSATLNLSMLFAEPYEPETSATASGIPIPLSSNTNERPGRKTLKYTYEQIINDLKESEKSLPIKTSFQTQPNKIAARAILSRVYLLMGDYENAALYAEQVLNNGNELLNYNLINSTLAKPFPRLNIDYNSEIILYNTVMTYSFASSTGTIINPDLYVLYEKNDLRKNLYFLDRGNGIINFKGQYTGNNQFMGGPCLDEIYLILAESLVRLNKVQAGINILNDLLLTRYKIIDGKSTFTPYSFSDQGTALKTVLVERRKELIARGMRWSDLRRLNKEKSHEITIERIMNGHTHSLTPNSKRYTFPIPVEEIRGSGIEQNER